MERGLSKGVRPKSQTLLTSLAGCVLLVASTGCQDYSPDNIGHENDTPPETRRLDGPLASVPEGAAGIYLVRKNEMITDRGLAIDLEVTGAGSVVLDGVRFLPFRGVPVPEVVEATIDGEAPVGGFEVRPMKEYSGSEPKLILSVRTDRVTAYNRLVQVTYHDDVGVKYAALFDLHWVMCLKAEVTERVCIARFHAQLYGEPTTIGPS